MKEIFNLLLLNKISPNQFYLLFSMNQGVSPPNINIHQEHRFLLSEGWVNDSNKVTLKGIELLEKIELFFKVQKKKVTNNLMGSDAADNIQKYLELFPKGTLPSGKRARSDKKNIETNFEWFFKNYTYSWDNILQATSLYVDKYQRTNFNYMRTSQYFIKKSEKDNSVHSELADYCDQILSGDIDNESNHFSEKIV